MVKPMWSTAHASMDGGQSRQLRRLIDSELATSVRSRALADERAHALASTGGQLPPFPTVHSSLGVQRWVRDHHVHYPPSGAAARDARSLPMRGPNPPAYWLHERRPPPPGATSSSEVGAHMLEWGGLYNQTTFDINLASARGQASLELLRQHHTALPFVPSQHTAAMPVPGYSLPYRAAHQHRPMLESAQIGAFHHAPLV